MNKLKMSLLLFLFNTLSFASWDFGFDYPGIGFEYQKKEKVYVIGEFAYTKLHNPVYTIYFDFDKVILKQSEKKKLRNVRKGDVVVIRGYASPEGTKEYNQRLSKERAEL